MTQYTLESALDRIATEFGFDADMLIEQAEYDPIGGYHPGYPDGFPIGSIFRVEGKVLYALVRALNPSRILELGTSHGCSTSHLAAALLENGNQGIIDTVDNALQTTAPGDMIPEHLREAVRFHRQHMEDFVRSAPTYQYDMIFEDGMHEVEQISAVWAQVDRLLKPGGMIISHDALHYIVGEHVRQGIYVAGFEEVFTLLVEPSDCGFAMWRKALESERDPLSYETLSNMTVSDLRDFAAQHDIRLPSSLKVKSDVISAILESWENET